MKERQSTTGVTVEMALASATKQHGAANGESGQTSNRSGRIVNSSKEEIKKESLAAMANDKRDNVKINNQLAATVGMASS